MKLGKNRLLGPSLLLKYILLSFHYSNYCPPQTKFAKVMFLHLFVSNSVHKGEGVVCLSACWDTPPGADTPQEQTPPGSRHPPSPQKQTLPREQTPSRSRQPLSPAADTPPGADTLQEQTPPRSRHTNINITM